MNFLISHSSKDAIIADALKRFLETLDEDSHVFCSSSFELDKGINYEKEMGEKLKQCHVFIPLVSTNYIMSKFCLIEFGFVCAKHSEKDSFLIQPFCLPPVENETAFLHTPFQHIEVLYLCEETVINKFVSALVERNWINSKCVKPQKIHDFIDEIKHLTGIKTEIFKNALILPICSNLNYQKAITYTKDCDKYQIDFNVQEDGSTINYDFISIAFTLQKQLNLYDYLQFQQNMAFSFEVVNETGSISFLAIEFKNKYHKVIEKFMDLEVSKKNTIINLPIHEMDEDGIKEINEICFIVWRKYVTKNKGLFVIKNIRLV